MNFHGNYLLARTVFQAIEEATPVGLGPPANSRAEPLSEQQCAERLAQTEWNDLRSATQIFQMLTLLAPFTSQLDHRDRAQRWKTKLEAIQERLKSGGIKKAIAVYQKALSSPNRDWMIRMNFGELLSECDALDGAEQQFLEALVLLRHGFTVHCKLGHVKLKRGRMDEASAHFREALRLSPDFLDGHYGLAEVATIQGKNEEALAIYEDRVEKGNNRLAALMWLAAYLVRIGKLDDARDRFTEALQLSPNNATALEGLGDVALKQGQLDVAIEHYEAALRIWPDWPGLLEQLAKVRKMREQRGANRIQAAPGN